MKEVLKMLEENRSGYLATVDNGKPRVRPFEFQFEQDGRLYFCTSTVKDVFNQLKEIPYIEFSATSKEYNVVRVAGEIIFVDDMAVKEKIISGNGLVRSIYKTADNPIFSIFYMEHGEASILSLSKQETKRFNF